MTNRYLNLFSSLVLALFSHTGQAALIFEEDFENYGNAFIINATSSDLNNEWAIIDGTVDYLAGHLEILCQTNSNCIDLDGNTGDPGLFSTTFLFNPGIYNLSFDLIGNFLASSLDALINSDNVVTVTLGGTFVGNILVPHDSGLTHYDYNDVLVVTAGPLSFQNSGSDNYGAFLDNISVAVPVASTWILLLTGLGLLSLLRGRSVLYAREKQFPQCGPQTAVSSITNLQ